MAAAAAAAAVVVETGMQTDAAELVAAAEETPMVVAAAAAAAAAVVEGEAVAVQEAGSLLNPGAKRQVHRGRITCHSWCLQQDHRCANCRCENASEPVGVTDAAG